jgi:hypothetical protein
VSMTTFPLIQIAKVRSHNVTSFLRFVLSFTAIHSVETAGTIIIKSASRDNVDYTVQSIVLVGLSSGEFGAVSFTDEQIVGRWRLRRSPVLAMKSELCAGSSECVTRAEANNSVTDVRFLVCCSQRRGFVIAAADRDGFGLFFIAANGTDDEFRTTWAPVNPSLQFLDMALHVEKQDSVFFITVWTLLQDIKAGDVVLQAHLVGLNVSSSSEKAQFISWPQRKGAQWRLATQKPQVLAPLALSKILHSSYISPSKIWTVLTRAVLADVGNSRIYPGDVTNPSCVTGREKRALLMLRSSRATTIFASPLPSDLLNFNLDDSQHYINLDSDESNRFVWSLASESDHIVDASAFSECWQSPTDNSAALWLIAAITSPKNESRIEAVKLSEFGLHSPGCEEPFDPSRLLYFPVRSGTFAVCLVGSHSCIT